MGQTDFPTAAHASVNYFIAIAAVVLPLLLLGYLRERRWRLRETAWGQGYAKEAAIASLDLAFGRFGAPHVVALTIGPNKESQGLMRRLGMTRREDLDFDDPRWGPEMNPTIVYSIDSGDWPAARQKALS